MDERSLARLAATQHGVVSVGQLRSLGLGYSGVSRRVEQGRLVRVHRGVYLVGAAPLTQRGRWMAAVLAAAPGAAVADRHAAAVWDIGPVPNGPVTLAVGRGTTRGASAVRLRRRTRLPPEDLATVDGIPVTTVARTIVDLARLLHPGALQRTINEAEIRRLLDLRAIEACLAHLGSPPGARALRTALAHAADGRIRSELEADFASFVERTSLPRPRRNAHIDLGGKLVEVDALWPEQRLAVELDGRETHGTRAAFEADRRRDAALQIAGFRILRVTSQRMKRDARGLEGDIRALLTRP